MATIIGDLAVRVGADVTSLVAGMDTAKKELKNVGAQSRQAATKLAKIGAASAVAGAALAASVVANSIKSSRELSNLARVSNTSVTNFQKLAYAAKKVGIEQDKLATIYTDMSDRVGDFLNTGGGPMADFFEKIGPKVGVTAEQFKNLSGPQALQLYVSSLEKANLSQNEMTFYMEAIASDSTALLPLLKENGKAMAEQAREAEKLGFALSEIEIKQLEAAAGSMDQLRSVFSGFADKYAAKLAPVISNLADEFLGVAMEAGGVGEAVEKAFKFTLDAVGFAADAMAGFARVVELAGKGMAVFALATKQAMLKAADFILNEPIRALNQLTKAINAFAGTKIPTVNFTEWGKTIAQELVTTYNAHNEAVKDIKETLLEPLPSSGLLNYYNKVVSAADAAAEKAAEVAKNAPNQNAPDTEGQQQPPGYFDLISEDEYLTQKQEQAQLALEKAQEYFQNEQLALEEHQLKMSELQSLYNDHNIISEADFQQARLDTIRDYANRELGIKKSAFSSLENLTAKHWDAETSMAVNALGNIVSAFSSNSKSMFNVQKKLGIANSVISTYTGAAKALELGWPLGPIAAASVIANGFAKVSAIRSQSFGGSGGAGAGGGGVSVASVTAAADAAATQAGTTEAATSATNSRSTSIDISLINADSRDRAVAGSIIEQINAEIEGGGRISRIGLA